MAIHTTHNRYRTPPYATELLGPPSAGSDRSSLRSASTGTSPHSINTIDTSPSRSPGSHCGRDILPRIRKQDQALDPITVPLVKQQYRCDPGTKNAFQTYNQYVNITNQYRRSASPADINMVTPLSAVSFMDTCPELTRDSPPPNSLDVPFASLSHSRSVSASSVPNNAYYQATSAPRDAFITRYAYPTYRQTPTYAASATNEVNPAVSAPHSLNSQPIAGQVSRLEKSALQQLPLSPELDFESYAETPATTNLMEYLTQSNPSPSIVRRLPNANRLQDMHFWWDIRNIRTWADFNLETIKTIPGLSSLLELDIPEPALPAPQKSNLQPETLSSLHDTHTAHYLLKVNAALKVSLGSHHLKMRASKPQTQAGAPQVPEYIANCSEDAETVAPGGETRSRVIGLVRSYEQWNSGMRNASPTSKITYLRELASLHRFMREHSCRYGYIITEIELVCVRMGNQVSDPPIFGLLELAAPIQLNASGKENLTAPLALWYLHMLAGNFPLQGQCSWRVNIGPPSALSRRNIAERDTWINLKPEGREKRDAKRNRGWVLPEEPLSRRECGRPRRWTKKMERERLEKSQTLSIAY